MSQQFVQPVTDPSTGLPTGVTAKELLAWGIPASTQGAQFLLEEQAASAARFPASGNPFAGWTMPPGMAGDFWQLFTLAETFAANTGWKYLPTPQQLTQAISAGMNTADQLSVFRYFAQITGVDQSKMPWAAVGLNATQYGQQTNNLNDTLYSLTGKSDFASAGLGSIQQQALTQGWSGPMLQDYIVKNPSLNSQYGWLQHGYNYTTFQNYKVTNGQALRSRFGQQFTDQQAVLNLASPLDTFHASGSAFGQQAPFVASQGTGPTGHQSQFR